MLVYDWRRMKKPKTSIKATLNPQRKKIITVISVVLFSYLLFKGLSGLSQPVDTNLVGDASPVTLEGTLIKDTTIDAVGNYYIVNLTGNFIQILTDENLDSFKDTVVRVKGRLLENQSNNLPQTLSITEIEPLSSQL